MTHNIVRPSDHASTSRSVSRATAVSRQQVELLQEDDNVRRWAEEAMIARPDILGPPPPIDSIKHTLSRRESEGGMTIGPKTSAPPPGSMFAYDEVPFRPLSSTGERSIHSSDVRRIESQSNTFMRDRPNSMFATSKSSYPDVDNEKQHASLEASEQTNQTPRRHLSLKSCLKSGSGAMEEDSPITPVAHAANSSLFSVGSTCQKSVQICEDLPHRNDEERFRSEGESSNDSSLDLLAPSAQLVRRNAAHKRIGSDVKLQRKSRSRSSAHSSSHDASPNFSNSTYGSEDDAPVLVTPLDEHGPSYASASSRLNGLESRVANAITRDLDQSGNAIAQPLRLLSLSTNNASATNAKEEQSDGKEGDTITMRAPSVPTLSHSTLLDIGRESGLTPPASRSYGLEHSPALTTAGTNIVSAGLEMGLGVGVSSIALSGQLLSSTNAGTCGVDEPRFARSSGTVELSSYPVGMRFDDRNVSLTLPHQHGVKSDRSIAEPTFEELDWNDAELNRRRTTGGLQCRRDPRQTGPIGKRRVHRTGTQDPHGSNRASHSRHTSLSTMGDIDEAQSGESNGGSSSNPSMMESSPLDGPRLAFGTTSTPIDTPSHGHKAILSPSVGHRMDSVSYQSHPERETDHHAINYGERENDFAKGVMTADRTRQMVGVHMNNLANGLMGIGEVGHFGPGVRAKVAQLIESLIATVPMSNEEGEVINLIEYGAINSRSGLLLRNVVSALSKLAMLADGSEGEIGEASPILSRPVKQDYFDVTPSKNRKSNAPQYRSSLSSEVQPQSNVSFCMTHEDSNLSDFRSTMQMLETHPESYLDAHWQARHSPCLTNSVFPIFASRPFASRVAPPRTMHLGINLMDLHWTHTPVSQTLSRATTAQAELTAFLRARANEFKMNGLLVMAYIARTEDEELYNNTASSSASPPEQVHEDTKQPLPSSHSAPTVSSSTSSLDQKPRKDIWTTLSNTLAPCIQRLVSCGMLKSDVARHLLDLPMHPRTAKQTRAALKSVEQSWKLEWSCGLGYDAPHPTTETRGKESCTMPSEPFPLRLPHPAWKAYESGCLSSIPFTEHMIQLFKNLYESHFRTVLRERGRLSKGAVEFVLDSLWDALFSRIVDQCPDAIKNVEIEVCIYALRRL